MISSRLLVTELSQNEIPVHVHTDLMLSLCQGRHTVCHAVLGAESSMGTDNNSANHVDTSIAKNTQFNTSPHCAKTYYW